MNDPLLVVRGLSKSFSMPGLRFGRRRELQVVRDISFVVDRGRTFGLVGESGSGKTTIARLLVRLIDADQGMLLLDGRDLGAMSGRTLRGARRAVQIVAQDSVSAFDPRVTIASALAAAIRLHRLRPEDAIPNRVRELFGQVGLQADLGDRFPHQLSGGQMQRSAIAQALAVEPSLVILDEVVSALDAIVKVRILTLLRKLQRDQGTSFVFVSHSIADVQSLADTVGVLLSGRMVENGPADEVFSNPRHPYTRALLASAAANGGQDAERPRDDLVFIRPQEISGCAFSDSCALVLPQCRVGTPIPKQTGVTHHLSACLRAEDLEAADPSPMFRRPLSQQARLRLDLIAGHKG